MKWLIYIILITLMLFIVSAETYEFTEWEISEDGIIIIDGNEWEVIDYVSPDGYIRRVITEHESDATVEYLTDAEFIGAVEAYYDDAESISQQGREDESEIIVEAENIPLAEFFQDNLQYLEDIPVEGTFANVFQFKEGEIIAIYYGWYNPITIGDTEPGITEEEAKDIINEIDDNEYEDGELKIFPTDEKDDEGNKVFKIAYEFRGEDGKKKYIDAKTGEIIEKSQARQDFPKKFNLDSYVIKILISVIISVGAIILGILLWQKHKK